MLYRLILNSTYNFSHLMTITLKTGCKSHNLLIKSNIIMIVQNNLIHKKIFIKLELKDNKIKINLLTTYKLIITTTLL